MTSGDWQRQDVRLARRLGGDIYERSEFHRGRLDRAGLGKRGVQHRRDLVRLAPMRLDDVRTPSTLLLRSATGDVSVRSRARRRYWPVQWTVAEEVPLAYSSDDLRLLGDIGARMFEMAGVTQNDVVVDLFPAGPSRDHLQVLLGSHRSRISYVNVGSDRRVSEIATLSPTVVVGTCDELVRLLVVDPAGPQLQRVHTVMVVGAAPTPEQHAALVSRLGDEEASIVRIWAPDGVLSAWSNCRGGTAFHTSEENEIVEIVDSLSGLPVPEGGAGMPLWTGIGWHASAVVRLRCEISMRRLPGMCTSCGRSSPRFEVVTQPPTFADVLDDSVQIASWFAELQRTAGGDELAVWTVPAPGASSLDVLSTVSRVLGNAEVHMATSEEIAKRIEDAKGERFVDRRALPPDAEV